MPDRQAHNAAHELAEGALRGPAEAAWRTVERAWGPLERFVRARLLARGLPLGALSDCGQHIFTRVWTHRRQYRGGTEGEFWSWMRRICDNERLRWLEREARRRERFESLVEPDQQTAPAGRAADPPLALLNEERTAALQDCLLRLNERQREVLELTYFDPELPERAIAELLDCSRAYVHKLKAAGLRNLRACLERKGVE